MSVPTAIDRPPMSKWSDDAQPSEALASDLVVACINDESRLAALQPEWDALAGDIPFRTFAWLTTWWRHYRRRGDRLFVLCVRTARGQLVGLAPLYRTSSIVRGALLRFLGSGRVASDHLTFLAHGGQQSAVATALAQWLLGAGARQWSRMELVGVDPSDITIQSFCQHLAASRVIRHRGCCVSSWNMPLGNNWDAFLKQLSKPRRNRVRRLFRDVVASGRGVIHRVENQSQLARGFEILVELHERRRRSLGDAGCFADVRFGHFQYEVMAEMLRQNRLRLIWLEIEGQPAAVAYLLVGNRTAYMYQSGLNPDLDAHRPGWLLTGVAIQDALEAGLQSFDFLRGDEPYKASWSAQPQAVLGYRLVRRQPLAMLRHLAWRCGDRLKRVARRVLRGKSLRASIPHAEQSESTEAPS